MITNPNAYLQEVLESYSQQHIQKQIKSYQQKRESIRLLLHNFFRPLMYDLENSGSYKKSTDINQPFDLDVIVPFKAHAFLDEQSMFNAVYNLFDRQFRHMNARAVRRQKVSIGIDFMESKFSYHIDIVPGREFQQGTYPEHRSLSLYVNEFGKKPIKTNIKKQVKYVHEAGERHPALRSVIRLLKVWKARPYQEFELKSFLLELFVIRAFDQQDIEGSLWNQTERVLAYIAKELSDPSLKIKDPGNEENVVSDLMGSYEKQRMVRMIEQMIRSISGNSDRIRSYFPVNGFFRKR